MSTEPYFEINPDPETAKRIRRAHLLRTHRRGVRAGGGVNIIDLETAHFSADDVKQRRAVLPSGNVGCLVMGWNVSATWTRGIVRMSGI